MKNIITKIKNRFTNEDNSFLRNWERERTNAAFYGHSHVEEIDLIFSRHIRQIGITMQSSDFIQKVIRDERQAIVERLFKEKSHIVDLESGRRMVYIAEEVIAAINNRELR